MSLYLAAQCSAGEASDAYREGITTRSGVDGMALCFDFFGAIAITLCDIKADEVNRADFLASEIFYVFTISLPEGVTVYPFEAEAPEVQKYTYVVIKEDIQPEWIDTYRKVDLSKEV